MEFEARVDAIRREGGAMADAARVAGVAAPVPSCPEWTVTDLLGHLGRIHRWVAGLLVIRAEERGDHWSASAPPPPNELLDWFAEGAPMLADALTAAGPDAELWTWTDDKTAAFWARRQACETAIHRYDAQLAAGRSEPIERELAVDGVDEFLDLIPYWPWAERVRGNGETMHLHCTDGDGEWLAQLNADGLIVTREHAKGNVAARGSASDLMLFMYGRVPAYQLEVFGDADVLTRWRELVTW